MEALVFGYFSLMKNSKKNLKFRFGWGQLGNQETLAYAYLSLINRNPTYRFGSGNGDPLGIFDYGAALPDYPNPELGWETTTTTNIGFDGVFFNNLEMSFEYYRKITDDILQESDLPPSVGNENPPIVNVASVLNDGVELSLAYSGNIGELTYGVSGNLTTVHNEVLEMYDDAPIGGNDDRIEEGFPINYLWGFKVGGLYRSQDEIEEKQEVYDFKNITRQEPGDLWFQDVNGAATEDHPFYSPTSDSVVNDYDRTFIGKTIPGHYYGFSFDLAYKGFDLSAFFQGVGDVQKINGALRSGRSMTGRGNNFLTDVLNRWTTNNRNASIPRAVAEDPAGNNRFSDRWVEDAGYLRFGNLQLGYSVPPQSIFGGNAFQNLRVWIGGTNLFTITNWSGLDPENENSPIPRTYTMGVDVRF